MFIAYRVCQPDDHICANNGSQLCIPVAKKCDGMIMIMRENGLNFLKLFLY